METEFPMNLIPATRANSIHRHWYSLVLCYMKSNDNSNLIATVRAEFSGCITVIVSFMDKTPEKKK